MSPYPSKQVEELLQLIRSSDVDGVQAFLQQHKLEDLHFGASTAFAALGDQPLADKTRIVDLLLGAGYRIDTVHPALGTTSWVAAIERKDFDLAKYLASKGAQTSYEPAQWCKFLSGKNFLRCLPEMLSAGANEKELLPAILHAAERYNDIETFRRVLARIDDVNEISDEYGWPLFVTVCSSRAPKTEMAMLMLENGVDINAAAPDGQTGLMRAVYKGDEGLVRLLIERGADVSKKTHDGRGLLDFLESRKDDMQALLQGLAPGASGAPRQVESRRRIRIIASDGHAELDFEVDDPEWEELYNSCGIIEEPMQSHEGDAFVGTLRSPHTMSQTLDGIIEQAGLVNPDTAQRLRSAVTQA